MEGRSASPGTGPAEVHVSTRSSFSSATPLTKVETMSGSRNVPTRQMLIRALLATPLACGLGFFVWRLLSVSPNLESQSDTFLTVCALLSATLAIGVAVRHGRAGGGPWLMVAAGCIAWSIGHPAVLTDSTSVHALLNAGYVVLVLTLTMSVLSLCSFARGREAWTKLGLDLLPPAIAIACATWVLVVGPFVFDPEVSRVMRFSAILHGFGSTILLVLGVAGLLSQRRSDLALRYRVLLAAVGLLAVADALWLQRLTGRLLELNAAGDAAYIAGFLMLAAAAALSIGTSRVDSSTGLETGAVALGWESQVPNVALAVLLVLAGMQAVAGEWVSYGIASTAVGGLVMLTFVMARQSIVMRRDRHLRQEIGQLSEQIDGLMAQVGRDPLTGLLNHRAVHERLDHELARGRAFTHPVAVVLVDVDNFKTVNDTLGHQAGDRVLRAVAGILSAACRGTDVAARYAGDEFMLVLGGLDETHASSVCQRIAQEVSRVNDDLRLGHGVRVSLSIGVAVTHQCQRSVAQTVAIADAAMYDAKEGGKDQVVVVNADTLVIADAAPGELAVDAMVAARKQAQTYWDVDERRRTG